MGRAQGRPEAGPGLPEVGGVIDPAVGPIRSVTKRSAEACGAARMDWSEGKNPGGIVGAPAQAQRSGLRGKRRSKGLCDDDAQKGAA